MNLSAELLLPAAEAIDGYTVDAETKNVKITAGKNEITFYYTKRADLAYTVNYYEEGTTTELHDSKKVENQTFGAEVTEDAIAIDGYNVTGERNIWRCGIRESYRNCWLYSRCIDKECDDYNRN